MEHNQLKEIPKDIVKLQSIVTLIFFANQIQSVAIEITQLPNLKRLDLECNYVQVTFTAQDFVNKDIVLGVDEVVPPPPKRRKKQPVESDEESDAEDAEGDEGENGDENEDENGDEEEEEDEEQQTSEKKSPQTKRPAKRKRSSSTIKTRHAGTPRRSPRFKAAASKKRQTPTKRSVKSSTVSPKNKSNRAKGK